MMENTTPPATNARNILRPLPIPDCVDALAALSGLCAAGLCADGLLALEYWRL
jgi:hypothetical protein